MAKAKRTGTTTRKKTAVKSSQPDSSEVHSAADAVRRAKLELEKAQKLYDDVREQAVERLEKVRETTVGDVMDATLEAVRKRPALGLSLAALVGFFLGRMFRR